MKERNHIFIVYNGRFPSEQAHALFVAKTAESLSLLGRNITLLCIDRKKDTPKISAKQFFSLREEINIKYFPAPDFNRNKYLKKIFFHVSNVVFGFKIRRFLRKNYSVGDIVYTNDVNVIFFLKKYTVFFELHDFPERFLWLYNYLFSIPQKILVTNTWKEKRLHELFRETISKTFVELNAVDLEKFNIQKTKQELRDVLGLDQSKKIVLYTGHLFGWKGAETLAEAAELLSEVSFYFLGGKPHDVSSFKTKYSQFRNIHILGYQQHELIPLWQKAADVLVLPNSGVSKIARYYTSPMKLFEYIASRVPVVASDLPSIREIVDETMVYFAEPDSPQSFAEAITKALEDREQTRRIAQAYEAVSSHTWRARAERILEQLRTIS